MNTMLKVRIFTVIFFSTAVLFSIHPETKPITVNFRTMPALNCESYDAENWVEACNREKQRRLAVIRLEFSGKRYGNANITGIGIYPNLSYLNVSDSRVNDNGVAAMLRNYRLQHLDLSGTYVTDRGVTYLSRLSNLKILNLNNTAVTDSGIRQLAKLELLSFHYGLTRATPGSLTIIGRDFKKLRSLGLANHEITDRDLLPLVGIQDEKVFEQAVSEASVNPVLALFGMGTEELPVENTGLSELQELDLSGTNVSGEFIWILTMMNRLRFLNLSETKVTDETVGMLRMIENLEALSLNNTQITDDGVDDIADIDTIRALSLQDTKITEDALDSIAEMDSIEQVYLKGTNLPYEALQKFQEENPDIKLFLN